MSAIGDIGGCGYESDQLLPPRAGEEGGPSSSFADHMTSCPACSIAFVRRRAMAVELRSLLRWTAPSGRQSALSFAAVLERLDEAAFETRLAAQEPAFRRLMQPLERLRAPTSLSLSLPAPVLQLRPLHVRAARIAALAAAAALVAAVLFDSSEGPSGKRGLAAETAALSGRTPIHVEVVHLAPGSAAAASLRPPALLPRRGGP